MKTISVFIAIIPFLLSISCKKDDKDLNYKIEGEFILKIDDSIIYSSDQIDFYDFSSHLIYLKDGYSFSYLNHSFSNPGTFSVLVDSNEIYSGTMLSMLSSSLPVGPIIGYPAFYGNYIIPIGCIQYTDNQGNLSEDPRDDPKIIGALKNHKQFREGLSGEILSVQKLTSNKVKISLQLTNNDSSDLLYLDPDKMGLGLFHYFTNGLHLLDLTRKEVIYHKIQPTPPQPGNTWKNNDWLSVIKAYEKKTITILYDNFENITTGQFKATFSYSGLNGQVVKRTDLQQSNGRIWLGELYFTKIIILK